MSITPRHGRIGADTPSHTRSAPPPATPHGPTAPEGRTRWKQERPRRGPAGPQAARPREGTWAATFRRRRIAGGHVLTPTPRNLANGKNNTQRNRERSPRGIRSGLHTAVGPGQGRGMSQGPRAHALPSDPPTSVPSNSPSRPVPRSALTQSRRRLLGDNPRTEGEVSPLARARDLAPRRDDPSSVPRVCPWRLSRGPGVRSWKPAHSRPRAGRWSPPSTYHWALEPPVHVPRSPRPRRGQGRVLRPERGTPASPSPSPPTPGQAEGGGTCQTQQVAPRGS